MEISILSILAIISVFKTIMSLRISLLQLNFGKEVLEGLEIGKKLCLLTTGPDLRKN